MKRHRTAARMRIVARDDRDAVRTAANRTGTVHNTNKPAQPGSRKPGLRLASPGVRAHTLIPTGELDRRSAPMLEAEIERFFETGVTRLTLDLRELTYIDSIGVAVIAFRWRLCKRQGHDLALIPGSRLMQRTFEQAGITDLQPFRGDRIASPGLPVPEHGAQ